MATQAYSAFAETRMNGPRESDAAAVLDLDHVQAALLLQGAGPAAGAVVLAGGHWRRARPTADARIPLVVQWIIRDFVPQYEFPHVGFCPRQQRVDLEQFELRVPLHGGRGGPVLRLVAADGADPGVVAGDRAAQRHHLA